MYKYVSLPAIFLTLVIALSGCGGGNGNNNNSGGSGGAPGINVLVMTPAGPGAVDANQTLPITVKVTDDQGNAGVTWSVAPVHKGDTPGAMSDMQPTSATYNPPANVIAPIQVIVTATSVADPTRSASIPISLYPTPIITTQTSDLDTAVVNIPYNCIQRPIIASGVIQIPCAVNVSGGLGPYTWTLGNSVLPNGLSLAPGTPIPPATGATEIVGLPQAGQDPIVGVHSFGLTVTDSLGVATTASLSISVAPGQLSVVTPTLLSTVPNVPYNPVALVVKGGVPPYTWGLAPGSGPLPDGMQLTPNGAILGTPITGNGFPFALLVKDSQSPVPAQAVFPTPQPVNAKIIILGANGLDPTCQSTGNTLQVGTPYAFLFSGFDADGPITLSGSFTADAGGNLAGIEDIVRSGGAQTAVPLIAGSSIAFNQVGRGCLTLNTAVSSAQFRVAPTTLAGGSGGSGGVFIDGRIIEFDDVDGTGTRGTGFFRMQDSAAFSSNAIGGPYAFRFSGWNASGGHFAMAGTATAQSGLITSVSADINNAGSLSGALTGGDGTMSAIDANGRGTATIGIGSGTFDLIFYVVDANHLLFNSAQPASGVHPIITGEATTSAGPFSQATLNQSHIYRFGGSLPGNPDVGVGVLHFDGISALSGTAFERSGGTATSTTVSGQYAVDPTTGRFTFSGTSVPAIGYAVPNTAGVTGYLVGTATSASSGVMEFQTDSFPPGFQFSPINGRYGFGIDEMLDPQTTSFAGQSQDDQNGGASTDSYIDASGKTPPGLVPVLSYTLFRYTFTSDGSGTYGGNTFMVTNGAKIFYIDISPLNGHPVVVVGQRQQ